MYSEHKSILQNNYLSYFTIQDPISLTHKLFLSVIIVLLIIGDFKIKDTLVLTLSDF